MVQTHDTLEDKTMKLTKLMAWLTAAAVVVLGAAGCNDNKKTEREKAESEFFKGDGVDRVSPTLNTMISNGARNDAMLYPHHFEGGHLNSLGRSKVLLMLEDCDNCSPITVHLVNCGEGEVLAQRKAAVELYLKTTEGPNKLTFHPSNNDIIRLAKTENPPTGGAGDGADTAGASSGAGAGMPPPAGGTK